MSKYLYESPVFERCASLKACASDGQNVKLEKPSKCCSTSHWVICSLVAMIIFYIQLVVWTFQAAAASLPVSLNTMKIIFAEVEILKGELGNPSWLIFHCLYFVVMLSSLANVFVVHTAEI